MSDLKATTGPWEVVKNGSYFEINSARVSGEGIGDACKSLHWFDEGVHKDFGVAYYNAHLMAAAPDLYEALDALLDSVIHSERGVSPSITDDAIAALAKARGES